MDVAGTPSWNVPLLEPGPATRVLVPSAPTLYTLKVVESLKYTSPLAAVAMPATLGDPGVMACSVAPSTSALRTRPFPRCNTRSTGS